MRSVSAYVPCYNNAPTIVAAARSLELQRPAPAEIFVVDDGSKDDSVKRAREAGLRVIEMGRNCGRGAVRARAMEEAKGEFVLACDATVRLSESFLEKALPHFEDAKVTAVYGRVVDIEPRGFRRRWRARHLLKAHIPWEVRHRSALSTWGVLMRRDAVLKLGNFNRDLRHSEDEELGKRILESGGDVVMDPSAQLHPLVENSVPQLLERFWRWNIGHEEKFGARRYAKQIGYAVGAMMPLDLRDGDLAGAAVSFLTPHYFLWRRLTRKDSR